MRPSRTLTQRVAEATDNELDAVAAEVKAALEGDSNDAEHDALVAVADLFGVEWTAYEELQDLEVEGG